MAFTPPHSGLGFTDPIYFFGSYVLTDPIYFIGSYVFLLAVRYHGPSTISRTPHYVMGLTDSHVFVFVFSTPLLRVSALLAFGSFGALHAGGTQRSWICFFVFYSFGLFLDVGASSLDV